MPELFLHFAPQEPSNFNMIHLQQEENFNVLYVSIQFPTVQLPPEQY